MCKLVVYLSENTRVNCHFGPCGLVNFATLVQNSKFLHLGPCGFSFIAILVQK
ncbi:hypothetical protein HanIR_Chr05g0218921 [Helianthus annuus]|nr:hypothetical protein HanIR_Chr05g0218921 [Helianthus annuus]